MDETASESPAPGGGSVSAYLGALGIALGTMVANLSAHKRGWDNRWKEFSDWAEKGKAIQNNLLQLVDEDTEAFNRIIEAFSLPKKSEEEKKMRDIAVQEATKNATLVPLKVMEIAFSGFGLIKEMVENGNPNSISDAGVGALAIRSCIRGAFLNVRINASGLRDKVFVTDVIAKGAEIEALAMTAEDQVIKTINQRIITH
jgi:glutamate formiminotransferase/formiminotetrahydrofolate cyclodeaminase